MQRYLFQQHSNCLQIQGVVPGQAISLNKLLKTQQYY